MSPSEDSVGDVEVAQDSQVFCEGAVVSSRQGVKRVRRARRRALVASIASVTLTYLSNISQKFRTRDSQRHLVSCNCKTEFYTLLTARQVAVWALCRIIPSGGKGLIFKVASKPGSSKAQSDVLYFPAPRERVSVTSPRTRSSTQRRMVEVKVEKACMLDHGRPECSEGG